MPDEAETLTIQVNDKEAITALVYAADKKNHAGITVVLGHGAGANQLSGFMRMFAKDLSSRGLDVMTFNFIYMEQGRSVPDQKPKLEACFRAVIETALKHKKLKKNALVIGGKSIKRGEKLILMMGAANRDPQTFSEPDSARVPRDEGRDLVFGAGRHVCLGMNLAKIESRVTLAHFLGLPTLERDGPPTFRSAVRLSPAESCGAEEAPHQLKRP